MNKEQLARRNRELTRKFHQTPFKHRVRNLALRGLSYVPISQQKPSEKERILIIRPDHIGDVLLTTPAFHVLREARPDAEIHALVGEWSAPILETYDEIDLVLTLPFPGFDRSGATQNPYRLAYDTARNLRHVGYSAALILRPDHWWGAMTAYLAGIPQRIGYRTTPGRYFLSRAVRHHHEHSILQNMRLVEHYTRKSLQDNLVYRYDVAAVDTQNTLRDKLDSYGLSLDAPYVVIHPGAGTWVKQWDVQSWAAVGNRLRTELEVNVVITGGASELPLANAIADAMRYSAFVLASQTSLDELATILKHAQVVIGVDSGPLHLAAAVGTPTVTMFGPADPIEFAPWGTPDKHIVLTGNIACRPCKVLDWGDDDAANHPCLRDISVERVVSAVKRVLNPG